MTWGQTYTGVPETEKKGVELNMDTKRKHLNNSQKKRGQREPLEDWEENQKVDVSNDLCLEAKPDIHSIPLGLALPSGPLHKLSPLPIPLFPWSLLGG